MKYLGLLLFILIVLPGMFACVRIVDAARRQQREEVPIGYEAGAVQQAEEAP